MREGRRAWPTAEASLQWQCTKGRLALRETRTTLEAQNKQLVNYYSKL